MKSLIIYGAAIVVSVFAGIAIQHQWSVMGDGKVVVEKLKPLYWVAPMDSDFQSDKPGKSPMGMDLVPVYRKASDPAVVLISPAVEQNLGVRVGAVERRVLPMPIHTVGIIQLDEDRIRHVHVRAEGWVQQLKAAAIGDPVKSGELLFKLYSPTLVSAQEEYLVALNNGNRRLISASKDRLLALGISEQDITALNKRRKALQLVSFYAHDSGFITKLAIREGMYVKPASKIMSIGKQSSVWVIAEVFERQAAWLKPGQKVEMTTISGNGRHWSGEIELIYPVLKEKTRTVQVRIKFDNSDSILKANMFADLTIQAGDNRQRLLLPREAVIRGASLDRVVRQVKPGEYRSVIVTTGIESGQYVEILKGLSAGDRVVISAQFLIDSESNIDAEIARINGPAESDVNDNPMMRAEDKDSSAIEGSFTVEARPVEGGEPEMRCGADMGVSGKETNND